MVKYAKDNKPLHDLILGTRPWTSQVSIDIKSQADTHWWDHITNDKINHLQGSSTLRMQKLKNSLAKEPIKAHA